MHWSTTVFSIILNYNTAVNTYNMYNITIKSNKLIFINQIRTTSQSRYKQLSYINYIGTTSYLQLYLEVVNSLCSSVIWLMVHIYLLDMFQM